MRCANITRQIARGLRTKPPWTFSGGQHGLRAWTVWLLEVLQLRKCGALPVHGDEMCILAGKLRTRAQELRMQKERRIQNALLFVLLLPSTPFLLGTTIRRLLRL